MFNLSLKICPGLYVFLTAVNLRKRFIRLVLQWHTFARDLS